MSNILIYSGPFCPYCVRAKNLLMKKGVTFEEIDVSSNPNLRDEMIEKSNGRRTIPQIFINDQHIGGFDDLYALDKAGKLDPLLEILFKFR